MHVNQSVRSPFSCAACNRIHDVYTIPASFTISIYLIAELLVDEAMSLEHIGGVYGGNIKPCPFLCLVLKMLQIQPTKDIIIEFIKNPDYKYVRILGAIYLRIIGTAAECYKYLEPLYNDYRKIKYKNRQGKFELTYVDEFIDKLLREDRVCDVILPRIQKRHVLEETEQLEPRVSALDEDLEANIEESDAEEEKEKPSNTHHSKSPSPPSSPSHRRYSRSPSHSPPSHRKRKKSHSRSRSRSPSRRRHDRHRDRSSSSSPHRHRKRSRSGDRSDKRERRKGKERGEKSKSKKDKKHSKDSESKEDKEKKKSKKTKKSDKKADKVTEEEEEIRQANELRAKLGIKPLRV
jgi:pre-mRNA-splicing factor 38A